MEDNLNNQEAIQETIDNVQHLLKSLRMLKKYRKKLAKADTFKDHERIRLRIFHQIDFESSLWPAVVAKNIDELVKRTLIPGDPYDR